MYILLMKSITKSILLVFTGLYLVSCMSDPGYIPTDPNNEPYTASVEFSVYSMTQQDDPHYTYLPNCRNSTWKESIFYVFSNENVYKCTDGDWVKVGHLDQCSKKVKKTTMYQPRNGTINPSEYYDYLAEVCNYYQN